MDQLYVYFLVDVRRSACRVGLSRYPLERIRVLAQPCQGPVRFAFTVGTDRDYHRRFAAHRLHHEWYRLECVVREEFERLAARTPAA